MRYKDFTGYEINKVIDSILLESDFIAFDDYLFFKDDKLSKDKYSYDYQKAYLKHLMIKNQIYGVYSVNDIFSHLIWKLSETFDESKVYITTDRRMYYNGILIDLGRLSGYKKAYFNQYMNKWLLTHTHT